MDPQSQLDSFGRFCSFAQFLRRGHYLLDAETERARLKDGRPADAVMREDNYGGEVVEETII